MVGVDVLTAGISLLATVLLISRFGAIGAAIGTTMSFLTQKALYQWGLKTQTTVLAIDPHYVRPYVSIVVGVFVTLLLAVAFRPPIALAFVLVGVVSLTILGINRQALQIMDTYPELGRFKLMRRIFGDQSTP
jgi:O-antigen/teichoic acid export membrane protein